MAEQQQPRKPLINGFVPAHKGKKVTIRLITGGQTVVGTIEDCNPYEILLQTPKGQLLVFKHAIATLEAANGSIRPATRA